MRQPQNVRNPKYLKHPETHVVPRGAQLVYPSGPIGTEYYGVADREMEGRIGVYGAIRPARKHRRAHHTGAALNGPYPLRFYVYTPHIYTVSSVPVYIESLQNRGFSYDYVRDQWYDGKAKVSEDDVLIFLIRVAKSDRKYRGEAGSVAKKWLHLAKTEPVMCFARFKKLRLRRNRNRRVAGKDLYAAFREDVGNPLSDDPDRRATQLTTWCMHIKRFYDLVSDGGYATCRSRARMAGRVLRSVFIGVELVDADVERVRVEAEEIVEKEVRESSAETTASVMRPGFEHVMDPASFAAMLLGKDRFDRSTW